MKKSSYSKEEIFDFVKDSLLECDWVSEDEVVSEVCFADLALDYDDLLDLIEDIQEKYQIKVSDDAIDLFNTVDDIVETVYLLLI